MNPLLDRAIEAARALPASEQDAIGAILLEEIEDERRWEETFSRTQPGLAALAAKARADIAAGRVRNVGPDEL